MVEWNWAENNRKNIHPDKLTVHFNIKVSWKCHECKHEWFASVNKRTGAGKTGCPACAKRTSKQEDEVADFIKNYLHNYANMDYIMHRSITFNNVYNGMNMTCDDEHLCKHMRMELDIYIPELSLAIEYDGDYWHDDRIMMETRGLTNSESHVIKQQLCKQAGIELIFITERDWLSDTVNVRNMLIEAINYLI